MILKAFEDMMKKHSPERSFSFLERNYIEEFKEASTLRQAIWKAVTESRADTVSDYYELDDGLLLSVFFKNPPGRLLRRQWTETPKVFPDFPEWKQHIKDSVALPEENQRFLDIPVDRVGVLRNKTKFSFPSDNSIIRVDKFYARQKRQAVSHIIKDNFTFGLNER